MSSGQAPHMGAGSHPARASNERAADAPFPALPCISGRTFSRQSSPDLFPAVLLRELRLLHARKSCLRLCQAASTGTLVSAGGNGLGSGRGCRAAWPRRPPTAGCGRRSVTEVRAKTPMNVKCSPSGRPVGASPPGPLRRWALCGKDRFDPGRCILKRWTFWSLRKRRLAAWWRWTRPDEQAG
jgi:hypothetical protein